MQAKLKSEIDEKKKNKDTINLSLFCFLSLLSPFYIQHFYPDGGWGWIICAIAFLAHVLTTGFQLSYGLLLLYAMRHLGQEVAMETGECYLCVFLFFSLPHILCILLCVPVNKHYHYCIYLNMCVFDMGSCWILN